MNKSTKVLWLFTWVGLFCLEGFLKGAMFRPSSLNEGGGKNGGRCVRDSSIYRLRGRKSYLRNYQWFCVARTEFGMVGLFGD